MNLYLDDMRETPAGYDERAYTAQEAIEVLEKGGIKHISLDHDLGLDAAGTGYAVAVWIEEHAYDGTLAPLTWSIHSANPVGRRRMEAALHNADKYWAAARAVDKLDTNSTLENRKARKVLNCSFCRPHKGENQTYTKRGVRKPRKKDHR